MSKFIGTSKDTKSSRFLDDMMDDVNKLLNEKNAQEIDVLLTYVIINVKQNVVCARESGPVVLASCQS